MRRRHSTITEGFPPTINDARAVALAEAVATALPHGEFMNLQAPVMGAEDFSYVLAKVPGMMAFIGVAESGADWKQCCGIHSSKMVVDETCCSAAARRVPRRLRDAVPGEGLGLRRGNPRTQGRTSDAKSTGTGQFLPYAN